MSAGEALGLRPASACLPRSRAVVSSESGPKRSGIDADAPRSQPENRAGEQGRLIARRPSQGLHPPREDLGDRMGLGVPTRDQLALELEKRPDRLPRSAREAPVAAAACLLEASQPPQRVRKEELIGGEARRRDRVLLFASLCPELDGALAAAPRILLLPLGLAAPRPEHGAPAGCGEATRGLGPAAEPGVDRGVSVAVRDSHPKMGRSRTFPSDTTATFLRLGVVPQRRRLRLWRRGT